MNYELSNSFQTNLAQANLSQTGPAQANSIQTSQAEANTVNNASQQQQLPRHIAIVMDGNGRWAQRKFLPRIAGHNRGVDAVRKVVKFCQQRRIEALTLFAFSSENWKRSKHEVNALLLLLQKVLQEEVSELNANGIKLTIIGDLTKLPANLQIAIQQAQHETAANTKLNLNIALNYGGRWDIANAVKGIVADVMSGKLTTPITEDIVNQYIALRDLPPVDLFIRTSGEQRISNFLLWQIAYTEIYFTPTLWPDFNEESMATALAWFQQRERRYGSA